MFDSGLGGLSVWRAVSALRPELSISYIADQALAPYGGRDHDQIVDRSLRIGRHLQASGAELLVVACNTATAVAVNHLRADLAIPVVGVEPAVKPAAVASKTRKVGLLATKVTLESARLKALIERHAADVEVILQPGVGLVEQIEAGELESDMTRMLVATAITPFLNAGVDQIVLGCTHYPFLSPLIQHLAGPQVELLDPATAVARRVSSLTEHIQNTSGIASYQFMSTAPSPRSTQAMHRMLGFSFAVTPLQL
ncbi:glutamate racemase [Silvimonas terrae]|uniref:Glutamate racemase n=1 Tax=Silvimonas terrae TaxID=300266 RepID=A0A840R8I9_9NEIS|nr:glutamate racemase [Silvimonas terrae]MBB5189635.1 glutamate racemase [Silvimonas terrae]